MDRGGNMENERINAEGVEVGPEAQEANIPSGGDSTTGVSGGSIEERFAQILEQHHYAINGISSALMELAGRVNYLEEAVFGFNPEEGTSTEPKGE